MNSQEMKMPAWCEGARWMGLEFNTKVKKVEKSALGRARHGEKS